MGCKAREPIKAVPERERSKAIWNAANQSVFGTRETRNKIQSKILLQSTVLLKHAQAVAVQELRNHRGTENKKAR